jgi:hypothetical protein
MEPVFSNIKGKDVFGLYTSKCVRKGLISITRETVDSLKVSDKLRYSRIVGATFL